MCFLVIFSFHLQDGASDDEHDILDSEVSDIENEDSEDEPKAAKHKTAGKKAGAGAGKRGKRKGVAKNAEKRKEVRIEWSAHRTKGAVEHPFGIESGKSGYQKRSADVNKSPVSFFLAFITDAIISIAVTETNRYARQKNRERWVDLTKAEFFTFMAIQMFMGVVNAPEIDMYFCIDGNLWGGLFMLNCAAYMSRHRFYDILYQEAGAQVVDEPVLLDA